MSSSRDHRGEIAWGAFCVACAVGMLVFPQWQTVPFHWIWITITFLYGFRRWTNGFHRRFDHFDGFDRLDFKPQFARNYPRNVEQILDQMILRRGVAQDRFNRFANCLLVENILFQQSSPTQNRV